MRLSETIQTFGFFWLPREPDKKESGILRISESGEATLELFGLLGDPKAKLQYWGIQVEPTLKDKSPMPDRVVGIIEKGSTVTLDQCLEKPTITLSGGRLPKSTIYPRFAFIGAQYKDGEEITFSRFRFSLEGLDQWLSISGIGVNYHSEGNGISGVSIDFRPPKDVSICLPDGIELGFDFGWKAPSKVQTITEAAVSQKAFISLKSKEPRSFEYFSSLTLKICNFLCFVIDQTVSLNSITGYSTKLTAENEPTRERETATKIYYESAPYSDVKPKIAAPLMLFRYPHVHHVLGPILAKWLATYETFEPALNLYFASTYDHRQYLDVRFLRLAQGIETLHRRSSQDTDMPDDEFEELMDLMVQHCPEDRQDWAQQKLKYANELSLRKRVKKMIEPFNHLFGNNEKRKSLVTKFVDTRNYLTHYTSELQSKAAIDQSLWHLCDKLEALFQLHLLRLIGFGAESIDFIAKDNQSLSMKLRT